MTLSITYAMQLIYSYNGRDLIYLPCVEALEYFA